MTILLVFSSDLIILMDFCLILQSPEDKINAIGSFLYNIQYFLDSFCMTIKFDQ